MTTQVEPRESVVVYRTGVEEAEVVECDVDDAVEVVDLEEVEEVDLEELELVDIEEVLAGAEPAFVVVLGVTK